MSELTETAADAVAAAVAESRADARAARIAALITAGRANELRDALRAALVDPRAEVRRRVVSVCSEAFPGDEALREPLLAALSDPVWGVREAAVVTLGRFADPNGALLARLVELTLRDPCPLVRRAAATTAGARIDPERDYSEAIRHPFERQRIRAACALGFTSRERAAQAVGLLASGAGDPHPKVRTAALRALARLDPTAVLPLLPVVVRRRVEAEPGVADAARILWERLLADSCAEVFHPLREVAAREATRTAIEQLPEEHPLRRAWDSLPLSGESPDAHRFARHLARVCQRVLQAPS
jgi:HEAT repeat protein